jgi:hypothetical protein
MTGLRSLGFMLAFLALCLKLSVPVGFMPASTDGMPGFAVCISSPSAAQAGKGETSRKPSSKAGMECVFSLLHTAILAAADNPAPGRLLGAVADTTLTISRMSASISLFAPPPPAHAPPSLTV